MNKMTRISIVAKQRSRQLRRSLTETEDGCDGGWVGFRSVYKFRRQHPLWHVLHFVCLDAGLVIEVDGANMRITRIVTR